jgi:hypothetical protein
MENNRRQRRMRKGKQYDTEENEAGETISC